MCSVFVLARICERCKYWWLSRCRTVSVALVLPSAFTDAKPCRGNQHQQRAAKTRVPNVNGCMRAIVRMFLCVFACICARVDPIIHEVTCLPSSQRRILFLSFLFIFYVYITCALDEFFFLLIFISVFFFSSFYFANCAGVDNTKLWRTRHAYVLHSGENFERIRVLTTQANSHNFCDMRSRRQLTDTA